jgi:hypothetical protein
MKDVSHAKAPRAQRNQYRIQDAGLRIQASNRQRVISNFFFGVSVFHPATRSASELPYLCPV